MKNIVIIAPHGTGKGTQCDLLVKNYGYNHISTGELFREIIKKNDDFSKSVQKTINSGKLVSDEIVLEMLSNYINENNLKEGIIFDGYPRTLKQAKSLDLLMDKLGSKIDLAIYLEISKEEALKRTLGRLICPNCKKSYNKFYDYLKPQVDGVCDDCKTTFQGRPDDTEEAFNNLFEVFLNDTYPILNYYQEKNILKKVDASKNQNEMFAQIEESLKEA